MIDEKRNVLDHVYETEIVESVPLAQEPEGRPGEEVENTVSLAQELEGLTETKKRKKKKCTPVLTEEERRHIRNMRKRERRAEIKQLKAIGLYQPIRYNKKPTLADMDQSKMTEQEIQSQKIADETRAAYRAYNALHQERYRKKKKLQRKTL